MNMAANAPLTVHPAAEAYRLMTDEELASLAASIAADGQEDPIILGRVEGSTEQHAIVDGRNRAKACGIAGVVPQFVTREFKDSDAIIAFVKKRSERRDLSKGERAMGHAWLYPEPEKGGRGNKSVNSKETLGFSIMRLSQARTVLAYSRELAIKVRDGVEKLDDAIAKVKADRKALDSTEAMLTRLRADAPDLADLVAEDRLPLKDAIASLDRRTDDTRREQTTATGVLQGIFNTLFSGKATPEEWAERLTSDVRAEFWNGHGALTKENLRNCAETMKAIAKNWSDK
jgi:hypothetical protein